MIFAKENNGFIELRFKIFIPKEKFAEIVNVIKALPSSTFNAQGDESYWSIALADKQQLIQTIRKNDLVWEEKPSSGSVVQKNISDDITHLDELKLSLYPFQVLGVNFLCDIKKGMIADEMGLGKSAQVIAATYKLYRMGEISKALIVCPASLKYQWAEEIEKFLDLEKHNISQTIIDGTVKQRKKIYEELKTSPTLYTVINYELVLNDIDTLMQYDWDIIACDEAHRIKNWESQTSKAIKKLDAPCKWAATGTPVQNKPDELFNIFSFIDPEILGNWWKFRNTHVIIGEKFNQPNMILGYKKLDYLHQRISPFMLRRLKVDVAPNLPDMIISNRYVPMRPHQERLHERVMDDLYELIKEISQFTERDENGKVIKKHPRMDSSQGMFTLLQEICDDPEMLGVSESKMTEFYYKIYLEYCKGKPPKISPKVEELDSILDDFFQGEGTLKAVVFTRFVRMQGIILQHLGKKYNFSVMNGNMTSAEKHDAVANFKKDPKVQVLLTTDSGNYGINCEEASLLIHFDIPWNPAVWLQRNGRIHRIVSTHDSVNIINLLSKNGLDERMLKVLYDKKMMSDTIVETRDEEKAHIQRLTTNIMQKLLTSKNKGGKKK